MTTYVCLLLKAGGGFGRIKLLLKLYISSKFLDKTLQEFYTYVF